MAESPEYRTIRNHYNWLSEVFIQGKVPGALFQNDVISEETLEIAHCQYKTRREKGVAIMKDVLRALRSAPTEVFQSICESVGEESSLKNVLDELNG